MPRPAILRPGPVVNLAREEAIWTELYVKRPELFDGLNQLNRAPKDPLTKAMSKITDMAALDRIIAAGHEPAPASPPTSEPALPLGRVRRLRGLVLRRAERA